MSFEVFKGKKTRAGGREPGMSISKTGQFTLNRTCVAELLKDVKDVELLYDVAGKRIGFRPVKKAAAHSYALRLMKGMGQVSGTAFLQSYGLMPAETHFYPAKWDEEAKAMVICLKDGQPSGRK